MRLLTFAALLISSVLTALAVWQITESPDAIDDMERYEVAKTPGGDTIVVIVQAGEGPQEIGEHLLEAGVIDSATQFSVLVSFLGYDGIVQAGEYEFQRGTPALDAAYRLRRGLVSTRSVTVVEGWRLEEVADAFAAEGIDREEFLKEVNGRDFYDLGATPRLRVERNLEGYLFPATYSVRRADTANRIVNQILESFTVSAADELRLGAESTGLTEHEVVTLASIIEREAQVPADRPIMAQVFLSRLEQGIPLQADPTVQYAIAADPRNVKAYGYWKTNLTSADLKNDSPYNTYQHQGLPPGPICNPGLASIRAVLNPADTNFLYFVAEPDGSHLFAETFEEHLENIEKVQGQ